MVVCDIFKQRRDLLSKALRSQKYKQGKNRLCSIENDEKKYCCLGVACEIYNENVPDEEKITITEWTTSETTTKIIIYNGNDIVLPDVVAKWYNITTTGTFGKQVHLTGLNDSGLNFNYIADVIDSGLLQPYNKE